MPNSPRPRRSLLGALLATLLVGLLPLLPGCGDDPVAQEVAWYVGAVNPLLSRNHELSKQFLKIAKDVHSKKTDAETIARQLQDNIIPVADGLKAEITAIQPTTPQLASAHQVLVEAWTVRSTAYSGMLRAFRAADSDAFDAASKKNVESKIQEEDYFATVNPLLGAYGFRLAPFP